jgi:hypothetical protein
LAAPNGRCDVWRYRIALVCAQFPNRAVHDIASCIAGLQLEAGSTKWLRELQRPNALGSARTRALCHTCQKISNMIEIRLSVRNGRKRREIAHTREQFGGAKCHACHLALLISLVCVGLRSYRRCKVPLCKVDWYHILVRYYYCVRKRKMKIKPIL